MPTPADSWALFTWVRANAESSEADARLRMGRSAHLFAALFMVEPLARAYRHGVASFSHGARLGPHPPPTLRSVNG